MATPRTETKGGSRSARGSAARSIAGIVVLIVLLVFILQNSDDAKVDLLFWDATLSLWAVILIGAGLGFLVGWFLGRSRMKRRERRT